MQYAPQTLAFTGDAIQISERMGEDWRGGAGIYFVVKDNVSMEA